VFKRSGQFLLKPFILFKRKAPLFSYIVGRTATMLVMLFLLGFAIFGLMALAPGDIVSQLMEQQLMATGGEKGAAAANIAAGQMNTQTNAHYAEMRHELGLDQPFYIQYFKWLDRAVLHQDLGTSLISKAPVSFLIATRLWNSVALNLISLVLITFISFLLGVYFATKAGTLTDTAVTFFALFLNAIPGILLLILAQLFAYVTRAFPLVAYPDFSFSSSPFKFSLEFLRDITLPLICGFLGGIGGTLRTVRALMLDQTGQPYIVSLRARGIAEWRIYLTHAFRNTLNPFITGSANMLAGLFSGSLLTEIMFSYPGIGRLMYQAIQQEDINLVVVNLMFTSFLTLLGMLISDILLAVVDPRIRYGRQ
jgi:peptide/nickel transport system permease protein